MSGRLKRPNSSVKSFAGHWAIGEMDDFDERYFDLGDEPPHLVISTAFVESLVNSLVGKRFAKKQSRQWTPRGAHLPRSMQTRTKVLNQELAATFCQWYPDFQVEAHYAPN